MRTSNWIITAALLGSLSAAAQQADVRTTRIPKRTGSATGQLGPGADLGRAVGSSGTAGSSTHGAGCSDHDGPGGEPVH